MARTHKTPVVMVPDLFDGDPAPLNRPDGFDMPAWRNGRHYPKGTAHLLANIDPIVETCLVEMRTRYGCKACTPCTFHKSEVKYLAVPKKGTEFGYL